MRKALEQSALRFFGGGDAALPGIVTPYGKAEWHRRHYFHLECKGEAPETWRHFESHHDGHPGERIEFAFSWVTLPLQALELAAGQGDLLDAFSASMRET